LLEHQRFEIEMGDEQPKVAYTEHGHERNASQARNVMQNRIGSNMNNTKIIRMDWWSGRSDA